MKLNLLQDIILVKFIASAEKTQRGLVIPRVARNEPCEAIVLQIGSNFIFNNGALKHMPVKKGDRILAAFTGEMLEDNDKNIRIIQSKDILAIKKKK